MVLKKVGKEKQGRKRKIKNKKKKKKQGRVHGTRCAWHAYLSPSKITRDGRTDGQTDGRTDTTSYRDATAHLKTRP